MKSLLVILFSLFVLSGFSKNYMLIVQCSFKNIEAGYDHQNKSIIYLDGRKIRESDIHKESETSSTRVPVPEGEHTIKVENWAFYNDKWELHSKENNYSFYLINSERINVHHHLNIKLIYDLDNGAQLTYQ